MKECKHGALLWVLAILPACGQRLVEFPQADGARPDSPSADVAIPDAAIPDAAIPDAAIPDVAITDTPNPETAITDAGSRDEGNGDVRLGDAAISDSGNQDAEGVDATDTDAANIDAPTLDAPNVDAPTLDAPSLDLPGIDAQMTDVGSIDGSGPGPVIAMELGLATPFAVAATAGVTNTMTSPITHINGNVVLTPDQTCNAVTVDNAGGFGLCAGMPPAVQIPADRLERSEASIRGAEEVGASGEPAARLHLQLAKDQTVTAKQMAANGEERALIVLARAESDAELALGLAREASVHADALRAAEDLKAVRDRSTR